MAVRADARLARSAGGRPLPRWNRARALAEVVRLLRRDPAFLALLAYRAKAAGQAKGVPVLPRLAHRLAMASGQVCIGDPVVVGPGVGIPRGNVVIDGLVEVGAGAVIGATVTIGLKAGHPRGPTVGRNVTIGDGAKLIGPMVVGDGAEVVPNAVVLDDVAPGEVVGGVPAGPIGWVRSRSGQ